jgi:hypothetical protein
MQPNQIMLLKHYAGVPTIQIDNMSHIDSLDGRNKCRAICTQDVLISVRECCKGCFSSGEKLVAHL